ncbi:MAG: hypothetical protein IKT89_07955 [Clostridia bacterium]|nr:hypothetical protein [Clostridia bacterium]
MTLTEKVAYLKGLAEGLNLDENAKETKLFNAMFDILEEMALTVNEIDEDLATVEEYVECIDEDLDELEEFIYDDECDCGCGCGSDCDCGCQEGLPCTCGCCDDDDELYEVECPSCGEAIYLDESMFDEEYIECPECGEKLELDIDFEDCDCDCSCCEDDED